jgi:hypothetical protein
VCWNCLSAAEAAIAQAALIGYAVKGPVHRTLARAGLAAAPDPVAREVRTVAFLRSLDLDPIEILGADVVAAASAWRPPQPLSSRPAGAAWTRPIASQARLATQ